MVDVSKILKEIAIKAFEAYKNEKKSDEMNDRYNQSYVATKTNISSSTMSRYLNPNAKNTPSLIELMAMLDVMNKREFLLEFAGKSKCSAAKFIAKSYPEYIKSEPVKIDENVNDEILRMTHESHVELNEKIGKMKNKIIALALIFLSIASMLFVIDIKFDKLFNMIKEHDKNVQGYINKAK